MDHFTQFCAEMPLKMQNQSQRPPALAHQIKELAQQVLQQSQITDCKERGWCSVVYGLNCKRIANQQTCLAVCTDSLLPNSIWDCVTWFRR